MRVEPKYDAQRTAGDGLGHAIAVYPDDVPNHDTQKNQVNLRQLEFLRLDEGRILVILVLDDREVQNRIIYVDEPFLTTNLPKPPP